MKMQPVTSSNIQAVGHEGTELRIEFKNGNIYRFPDVSREDYEQLISAESVGKAFNQAGFRGRGEKVVEDEDVYVLVLERDTSEVLPDSRPIVFEQYVDQGASSLEKVKERRTAIDGRYGKARIAKLQFLADDA